MQINPVPASLNILVAGDFCAGKSMLMSRLTGQHIPSSITPTIAINPAPNVACLAVSGVELSLFEVPPKTTLLPRSATIGAALMLIDSRGRDLAHQIAELDSITSNSSFPRIIVLTKADDAEIAANIRLLATKNGFDGAFSTSALNDIGINELREYLGRRAAEWRSESAQNATEQAVISAVRNLSERLCELIAHDPGALQYIHWRQLEEVIAAAMESIGFSVVLTPPSKDGGKDVIATCKFSNEKHVFYVEIKHWRAGGQPGTNEVSRFIEVNARDQTSGGLFLSSSGYTRPVYSCLAEVARQKVWLGTQEKIVSLCQYYVRAKGNVLTPQSSLPAIFSEKTLGKSVAQ